MKYAVIQTYKDGTVFPVEINITSADEAGRRVNWMRIGAGQFEIWSAVPMANLRPLLLANKVSLGCFTPESQAEKRGAIMEDRT